MGTDSDNDSSEDSGSWPVNDFPVQRAIIDGELLWLVACLVDRGAIKINVPFGEQTLLALAIEQCAVNSIPILRRFGAKVSQVQTHEIDLLSRAYEHLKRDGGGEQQVEALACTGAAEVAFHMQEIAYETLKMVFSEMLPSIQDRMIFPNAMILDGWFGIDINEISDAALLAAFNSLQHSPANIALW